MYFLNILSENIYNKKKSIFLSSEIGVNSGKTLSALFSTIISFYLYRSLNVTQRY